MPMMMDNPLDVDMEDDLFGDDVALLSVKPQPNKFLRQKLDEMRTRGCRQTISWSRSGTIASITADGREVELRFLRTREKDGIWELSEPSVCKDVQGTPANPLVHLEWAATPSPELAVFDDTGRVTVISFTYALNHPFCLRSWESDNVDNLGAAVGCYWLPTGPTQPQKSFNVLHGPAVASPNGYQYSSSYVPFGGPHHPLPSRTALLTVTLGGSLKLFWPQNSNIFQETSTELESVQEHNDLVTHASIASHKNHLLIITSNASKQLRLHKVDLDWGIDKMAPNSRWNPALSTEPLATTDWSQSNPADTSNDTASSDLTQLMILPPQQDPSGMSTAPAMVIAVRCSLAPRGSYQESHTCIDRWEVKEHKQALTSAFEQLGNRKNGSSAGELKTLVKLNKLESITIDKSAIRAATTHFGHTIVFSFADGSVEYRDRFTFEAKFTSPDLGKIMTLHQVGWSFPETSCCHQAAFSPTGCSMVQLIDENKVQWVKMKDPTNSTFDSLEDKTKDAWLAGFVISALPGLLYQTNIDDLLAIIQPYETKPLRLVSPLMKDVIRGLKIQVDHTEDQLADSIVRNQPLINAFGLMASMSFQGRYKPLIMCGKMASAMLNIRNTMLLLHLTMNPPQMLRDKINPLDEHEIVSVLAEGANWTLELMAWLSDGLFSLTRDSAFMNLIKDQKTTELQEYLVARNDISLHMFLCSSSRTLLSGLCRRMIALEAIGAKAHAHYQQNQAAALDRPHMMKLHQAYAKMNEYMSSSMINLQGFDKLLGALSVDIRAAYADFLPKAIQNSPNPPQGKEFDAKVKTMQFQIEATLVTCAAPPVAMVPTISKFLTKDVEEYKKQTRQDELFFAEYSVMEYQDDPHSAGHRAETGSHIDVFRRVELGPAPAENWQWRQCTRCTSVMQDITGGRPALTFYVNQQRKCSCGGFWVILPLGKPLGGA